MRGDLGSGYPRPAPHPGHRLCRACTQDLFLNLGGLGSPLGEVYLGVAAHADDIRTLTSNKECLEKQVQMVTSQSGLTLNLQKCEILISCTQAQRCTDIALASINGQDMKAQKEVKCLGYWWSWDLSANRAVSEAINKSRRAFFMRKT